MIFNRDTYRSERDRIRAWKTQSDDPNRDYANLVAIVRHWIDVDRCSPEEIAIRWRSLGPLEFNMRRVVDSVIEENSKDLR